MNCFLCYKLRGVTLFCYSPQLLPCYGGHGEELLSTSAMRNIPKEANSEAEIKRLHADANQNHIAVTSHPFGMVIVKNKNQKKQKVTTVGVDVEKPRVLPVGTCYVQLLWQTDSRSSKN